ncbi:MAG: hypothetical protein E4H28_01415 [Gemmatimonadales bacterium]|nr:MAG: hypothetical protein E4H28_01415 [Gemmatimonadales bacterium]
MSRRSLSGAVITALVLVAWTPATARSQIGPSHWDADERVLVTSFQRVTALARSPDRLFAATDEGLVVRNEAFGQWELPITREDGYPPSRVTALAWDRRDGTLWLATEDARLIQLEPFDRRFVDEIRLNERISRIIPSADDPSQLLVRTRGGWFSMDPFSRQMTGLDATAADRAISADFELRERRELLSNPRFDAARAFLATRGSTHYQITDVMPATELGQFWVSSYGGFLFRYDSFTGLATPVDYGLVGRGGGAVLVDETGTWFAPGEVTDRYAITWADPELAVWRTWESESIGPMDRDLPSDPIHVLLRRGNDLWAGGDRGVYRFDGKAWHREATGQIGVGQRVLSLASGPDDLAGTWVGTDRGLFRLQGPGALAGSVMLGARRITALASHAGGLWVGTDWGLAGFESAAGLPVATSSEGQPRGPVTSLRASGSRLYAGIDRDVWWLEDKVWHRADALGALSAPASALEVRDGIVFIGSDDGLIAWNTNSGEQRRFSFAAGDLPTGSRGEEGVMAVSAIGPDVVWLTTPAGAMRLTLD